MKLMQCEPYSRMRFYFIFFTKPINQYKGTDFKCMLCEPYCRMRFIFLFFTKPINQYTGTDLDSTLVTLKCSLYGGYFKLTKFPTFVIFLIFSNNPIAGCDFASPGPPDLDNIWGAKWQPVYGLFYITITCNFYEIYAMRTLQQDAIYFHIFL